MDTVNKLGSEASLIGGGTIYGDLLITGDLTVQGSFNFGDAGVDIMTIAGYIQGSVAGNTSVNIGAGTPGSMVAGTDSLYVTGTSEFDSRVDFDGIVDLNATTILGNTTVFAFGAASTNDSWLVGNYTFDQLLLSLGSNTGRQFVIGDYDGRAMDFDHATPTNPTLFVHSATAPDTANDQWISLSHDQANAVIGVGTGLLTGTSGVQLTIPDNKNQIGFEVVQNDVTNNSNVAGFTNAGIGLDTLWLNTNAGVTGVLLEAYHQSASPAADDEITRLSFFGDDDGANKTEYATISSFIDDPTNTSENGIMGFYTMSAGTSTLKLSLAGGVNGITVGDGTNQAEILEESGNGVSIPDLYAGIIQMPEDGGLVDLVDMAVTSTPASGTEEGYIFNVDGFPILTIKTEADSSGSIQTNKVLFNARILGQQGTDVASATNLTLTEGNAFELTGTTKVDLISNLGWTEGSVVTLIANENVTIDHGTATSSTNITILLAGAGDFTMTANDTLTLMLCSTTAGGQAWREVSRTAI